MKKIILIVAALFFCSCATVTLQTQIDRSNQVAQAQIFGIQKVEIGSQSTNPNISEKLKTSKGRNFGWPITAAYDPETRVVWLSPSATMQEYYHEVGHDLWIYSATPEDKIQWKAWYMDKVRGYLLGYQIWENEEEYFCDQFAAFQQKFSPRGTFESRHPEQDYWFKLFIMRIEQSRGRQK